MKTHELGGALITLGKALKASADIELKDLVGLFAAPCNGDDSASNLALSLTTMTLIAQVSKEQWKKKIAEWKLPIEIKSSDSNRDLWGRLSNYLKAHPDVWRKIHKDAAGKNRKVSSELMETLSILLGDEVGEDEAGREGGKKK